MDKDFRYVKESASYLRHDDKAYHSQTKGILGSNIHSYEVYVRNREYAGGYFTVRFYFEDYYGNINTEKITYYVKAHSEKRFAFKDVSAHPQENHKWWYEVVPESKVPTKTYYSNEGPYARIYNPGTPTNTYFYVN